MTNTDTLLAFLVPKLTSQVENAATDALGHILNKSKPCRDALADLLNQGGLEAGATIAKVATQVAYRDRSRPDMAGYDEHGRLVMLVEAKFWAALSAGQASRYAEKFDHCDPAALLFIAPASRIETLWIEIRRQFNDAEVVLGPDTFGSDLRGARINEKPHIAILTSWRRLLGELAGRTGDAAVVGDIAQLRGLTELQDSTAFLPVHAEEMSPSHGQRMMAYNDLINDIVGLGRREGWISTAGLKITPQNHGYGRYFKFVDPASASLWIGINHRLWAKSGDSPLWLRGEWLASEARMDAIAKKLGVRRDGLWVPLHPKQGVEYREVLDDAKCKLKNVKRVIAADAAIELGRESEE